MGMTEEAGKAAGAIATGLSAQPLALALVCINVAFLAVSIWFLRDVIESATDTNKRRDALMMQLIKDCTVATPSKPVEQP